MNPPVAAKKRRPRKPRGNQAAFERMLWAQHPENALRGQMIEARLRNGWTQEQIAERMGTTQSAIARWESGRVSPNVAMLKKLSEVTGSRLVIRLDEVGY